MKINSKFLLVVLLTVFSATTMYASPETEAPAFFKVIAEQNDKIYRVIFNSPIEDNVTIEIYNEGKELVHTEKVSQTNGFIKRYNLEYLALGAYEIVVKTPEYQLVEQIDLGNMKKYHVNLQNDGKNISLIGSHPEGRDFNVYILDSNNELLYSETIQDAKQVYKTYNLEKIPVKEVSFMIYSEEKLISQEIIKL